jgi:Flp pilus assembly pilin Flp
MGPLKVLWLRLSGASGQTMSEYALIIAVIGLVVIVAAVLLGGGVSSTLGKAASYT